MSKSYNGEKRKNSGLWILLKIFVAVAAIAVVLFIACIVFTRIDTPIFGYSAQLTPDEMSDVLPNGSLFITKMLGVNEKPFVNDVVCYDDEDGKSQMGRITRSDSENDEITYTIFGGGADKSVSEVNVTSVVTTYVPVIGYAVSFIVTPIGLIACVAVPLFLLLVFEIVNLVRLPSSLNLKDENGDDILDKPAQKLAKKPLAEKEGKKAGLAAKKTPVNVDDDDDDDFLVLKPQNPVPEPEPVAAAAAATATATATMEATSTVSSSASVLAPPISPDYSVKTDFEAAPRIPLAGGARFPFGLDEIPSSTSTVPSQLTPAHQSASHVGDIPYGEDFMASIPSGMIENMAEAVELVGQNDEQRHVFYQKPEVPAETERSRLEATREFSLPSGICDLPAEKKTSDFSADLQEKFPNRFRIDGIDVDVEAGNIKLSVDELIKGRDIAITVTKDYTNVVVDAEGSEIDFALFRDETDNEQKVIIRKKTK